ncbi:hypothetical protein DSO57_1039477 [Entomophthora muscae]|uniref:Uncharacterized protein n=1 Tax=Entomophthora muscae TaxID=34485 RepID=A0ACC2UIB0_9FUNG|nr:hypothetical protein DSO57_1039477 [Entomophthora muscae]
MDQAQLNKPRSAGASTQASSINTPGSEKSSPDTSILNLDKASTNVAQQLKKNRSTVAEIKKKLDQFKLIASSNEKHNSEKSTDLSSIFTAPKEGRSKDSEYAAHLAESLSHNKESLASLQAASKNLHIRTEDLQSQVLDQEETIQELEKTTQTLLESFRLRSLSAQEDFKALRLTYNSQISEEKDLNRQLTQENIRLRSLLLHLVRSIQGDILDNQDDQFLEISEEFVKLQAENRGPSTNFENL